MSEMFAKGEKTNMKKLFLIFSVIVSFLGCKSSTPKNNQIRIFVSILPQKYFVQEITPDNIEIEVMVKPGQSPATYEPTPKQMAKLSDAEIYFSIGVPFEKSFLPKLEEINPNLQIIHTDKNIKKRQMDSFYKIKKRFTDQIKESRYSHKHRDKADPHIWLSPKLVKRQIQTMEAAIIDENIFSKSKIKEKTQNFINKLTELQQYADQKLQNLDKKRFLVFHPSWGYLADEFELIQIPIQIEGKSPTTKELSTIIDFAKKEDIKVIFVQKQFSSQEAQVVANEIGGKVIRIDPLSVDYIKNLKKIIDIFNKTLR